MNTTYLTEGTNLYYTSTRFGFDFGAKNTDYLTQGTTNKYLNAFSISDTTEINHTYSTLSPILSSEINIGSIILSKLNSSVYSNATSPYTLVQRDSLGNFSTNLLNLNNITASALCTFSGGNNAQGVAYTAIFGTSSRSGQIAIMDGLNYNTYAQLYCRSNIFGIQGNVGNIQLEKPTKIATSLNVTNPTLASNYCTIDSTGVNIATGLTYEINGIEYFCYKNNNRLIRRN